MSRVNTLMRLSGLVLFIGLFSGSAMAAEYEQSVTKKGKSGVEVTMIFETDQLVAIMPVEVELQVVDSKGKPASNALVSCSMFMPNFATGSNRPKLEPMGMEGKYRGIVFFERAGLWHANLTINLADGSSEEMELEIGEVAPAGS